MRPSRAELAAWAELPIETVHALALRELAANLPQIEHLTRHARPAHRAAGEAGGGAAGGSAVSLTPRVVLVHRRTELTELVARHGTRGQAAFFLRSRGRDVDEVGHATTPPSRPR